MICALPAAAVRTVPVSQINVTAIPSLTIRILSVLVKMFARKVPHLSDWTLNISAVGLRVSAQVPRGLHL